MLKMMSMIRLYFMKRKMLVRCEQIFMIFMAKVEVYILEF